MAVMLIRIVNHKSKSPLPDNFELNISVNIVRCP